MKVFVAYETSERGVSYEESSTHVTFYQTFHPLKRTRSISSYAPVGSGEIGIRLVGLSKGTSDEAGAPKRISCDMLIHIT